MTLFLFTSFAHGQISQFTFDPNGNLLVQTAETGVPPQILGQPQDQVVAPGEAASFSVVVADTWGLSYQWRFNGADVAGATSEALLVQNAGANHQGQYSVVLVNASGRVTSAPATLMLDTDEDGLGDSWELAYFGNLNHYGSGDFDRDSVSNLQEFLDRTDPTDSASAIFRLTLLTDGGHVTVTPSRFRFANGETVTLTATAFAPHAFHGWGGDIDESSNPITVRITNHTTVIAYVSSYDIAWRSGANGDWQNRTNWNPKFVPASNDHVFISPTVRVTNHNDVVCRRLTFGGVGSAPSVFGSGPITVHETCVWLGGTMTCDLTVLNQMNWLSGLMAGSGRTLITPGAALEVQNTTTVTLRTRTVENAGTILWTGTHINNDGGIITNRAGALFEARSAAAFGFVSGSSAFGRFDNAGMFQKTSTGTTTFSVSTDFNNYAATEIQNGALALGGGGFNRGSIEVASGATLNLPGGTFTSAATASLNGAGNLVVSGGTADLAGRVNLGGTHTFSGGTANLTGDYISTNNTVIVSGAANFSGTGVIQPATVRLTSGTLRGNSALTVLSEFNWSGGEMSGSGRTVIAPGAALNINSPSVHFLSGGRTLENGGTILWTGGFLTMGGATITNRAGAVFDNQTVVTVNSGGGNRFDNVGTFRKSVNAGTATWPVIFNNSGLVAIQAGRLALGGGGTHRGGFDITAGASLNLSGGTHAADAASSISGGGDLLISGGTATLAGLVNPSGTHTFSSATANLNGNYSCTNSPAAISSGTVNFNTTSMVAVINLRGGTLAGSGVLNVFEEMNWSGGNMAGSGRTVIAPQASLNFLSGAAVTITSRTLENGGTVIWTGAGNLTGSTFVITNRPGALFELRNSGSFAPQGFFPWRFDNAGTLRKAIGTGTSTFASGVSFNNYGTVEIRQGIIAANGGYNSTSNSLLSSAIGGTTAGTGFGQLRVSSTVNLSGSLRVDWINAFLPAVNDSFALLTAGARSGAFRDFLYPSNSVTMQLSNTPNSVIARVTEVLVVPAPSLLPPERFGSNIRLIWSAIPNTTYRLEFKPALSLTDWETLPGDVTSLSNIASKADLLTSSNRFYRVRVVP